MITAERLSRLTSLDRYDLTHYIQATGYKGDTVESCKFLGLTNGGQFCYIVVYFDDDDQPQMTKVFLTVDPATDRVIADY